MKALRLALLLATLLPLGACLGPEIQPGPSRPRSSSPPPLPRNSTRPRVVIAEPGIQDSAPSRSDIPEDVANTPDAVPKIEPRSRSGNPDEYEAFGVVYHVLDDSSGFTERGRASWYGKKFHGKKTASGEPYDMFAMTAAHKTLPIPSYVRVTNLENGKTCVVRVNDRGPFHSKRIIDLSYAAAARIGITSSGHAEVEIRAVQPGDDNTMLASAAPTPAPTPAARVVPPPPPANSSAAADGRWLQVAVYADPINAVAMRDELRGHGLSGVAIRDSGDGKLHRVVIGPYSKPGDAEPIRDWLHGAGYAAFWIKD